MQWNAQVHEGQRKLQRKPTARHSGVWSYILKLHCHWYFFM